MKQQIVCNGGDIQPLSNKLTVVIYLTSEKHIINLTARVE